MNKFTLGAIAGISSLALAVPLLATVSLAQSDDADASAVLAKVPTQACLTAQADLIDARLAHTDEEQAEHQALMQEHAGALREVAAIGDETQRRAALLALHESMRDQLVSAKEDLPEDVQNAMDALKDSCGNAGFGMGIGKGMMMGGAMHGGFTMMFGVKNGGPMHDAFLEQLGMTQEELQAELDSGKTIQEIAEEKGVEFPEAGSRMNGRKGMGMMRMERWNASDDNESE